MSTASTASPPPPPAAPAARERSRVDVLDALRGVAIVLVVLSHGWILWPIESIDDNEVVRPVFRSGNFAVTVFLVVAGYLTFRALARSGLPHMRVGVTLVRRVLRVAPATLIVLPAVVLIAAVDSTDTTPSEANQQTVIHVATYTWNWHLQTDAANARWDLGHLWYLSVDMHAFIFMAVVLYLLRKRPRALVAALTAILLLFTWWRVQVTDLEPVLNVLLRTTARWDAFIVGVLIGAVLAIVPRPPADSRWVNAGGITAVLALPPLMWWCSTDTTFLSWGVTALELALAAVVGAAALGARALAPLASPLLVFLGRHSLPLYVWHYPTFAAVERHTKDWHWAPRAALAIAITALLCVLAHRLVERRVGRILEHPWWADRGAGDRQAVGVLASGSTPEDATAPRSPGHHGDPTRR